MQTLTFGFQLPQTGDKGNTLFTGLEHNIQQVNDHTHDGINSAKLFSYSVQSAAGSALPANWVAFGGAKGEYRQLLSMPAGYLFSQTSMSFRLNGDYVYPKLLAQGDSAYYIYTNDPTVTILVVYGG